MGNTAKDVTMVATIARTCGSVKGIVTNMATPARENTCISVTSMATKRQFLPGCNHHGYTEYSDDLNERNHVGYKARVMITSLISTKLLHMNGNTEFQRLRCHRCFRSASSSVAYSSHNVKRHICNISHCVKSLRDVLDEMLAFCPGSTARPQHHK
jgi:hypothetical protein